MNPLQWFLIGNVILCSVLGQTLLKYALNINARGKDDNLLKFFISLIFTPWMWVALVCYGTAFVIYLYLLSHIEVSRLYPTTVALVMILVSAMGIFIMDEVNDISKLSGLALIVIGVFLINHG